MTDDYHATDHDLMILSWQHCLLTYCPWVQAEVRLASSYTIAPRRLRHHPATCRAKLPCVAENCLHHSVAFLVMATFTVLQAVGGTCVVYLISSGCHGVLIRYLIVTKSSIELTWSMAHLARCSHGHP